jgi:hypothetical protein
MPQGSGHGSLGDTPQYCKSLARPTHQQLMCVPTLQPVEWIELL